MEKIICKGMHFRKMLLQLQNMKPNSNLKKSVGRTFTSATEDHGHCTESSFSREPEAKHWMMFFYLTFEQLFSRKRLTMIVHLSFSYRRA